MTHYLITKSGAYDRAAINRRAARLRDDAIAKGATGAESSAAYWRAYAWRVARAQHEAAAPARLVAYARNLIGEGLRND